VIARVPKASWNGALLYFLLSLLNSLFAALPHMEAAGIEPGPKSSGNQGVGNQGGAECGVLGAQIGLLDPELAALVDAWPALPEAIKTGILAMIRGAK
jgi:hypothetical protein